MKNKFITHKDIFDGQDDIPEKLCTEKIEINKYIPEDLVTLFKIKEIHNEIDNTIQIKRNRIEELEKLLNYSYDDF